MLSSKRIKKAGIFLAVVLIVMLGLWLLRFKILQAAGDFLIVEDELTKADAIVVLGGMDEMRPVRAAQLYRKGLAPKIITTAGGSMPEYMILFGNDLTYSKLNYLWLTQREHIPEDVIVRLNVGTSTYEEAQAIAEYAKKEKFNKVIVVTTLFHTRRARMVFKKQLDKVGVDLIISPSFHRNYAEGWWNKEAYLIFVNNEYMKFVYYIIKGRV